ncbi:hypothetical protein ERX46_01165 [Brumimicrobium glaciale]|uniref:Uncharacterized protein n=1 Tax=Brumimicrobium glaciale TaxID=200475 RepID=A0A4Q4KSI1_9FLAO|nr:hypothetical protein [Brumimicrobium glaciale]RYM35629.1 hypothetical protein ERX46_01165 [Brumimicrobium glaciale]
MRRTYITLLLTGLLFSLTGCFELIEDTTLNSDGSGSYKLTINLSASTTKVNSLMAMDSIKGTKVPSRSELQTQLQSYMKNLNTKEGISNAKAVLNTENWILNLNVDFESLASLRKGMIALSEDINKKPANEKVNNIILSFSENVYKRKIGTLIPADWREKVRKNEDFALLKDGKCVFIQRFDKEIINVSSEDVRIAKSKKAAMLQLTPLMLVNTPEKIDYIITTKR